MAVAAKRKKAVNLTIDAELAAEAKSAGTNLSAVLEAALRDERRSRWIEANREAIEANNAQLERDGMWYVPEWLQE